jgi:hypothetical protein
MSVTECARDCDLCKLVSCGNFKNDIQAALVIRGGYVPQKYREYQNRKYQVQ